MNGSLVKFLTFVVLLAPLSAFASGREGHGGNVVICDGSAPVVLDYYHASLPTMDGQVPQLVSLAGLSEDQTVDLITQSLERQGFLAFESRFVQAMDRIGVISKWISADLRQFDDSDEPYFLPAGCVRKTAAVRQENVVMYGDPSVINTLSAAQRGLLRIHEAFYLISSERGQSTSETVRDLMREVLLQNPDSNRVANAIAQLGGNPEILASVTPGAWQKLQALNGSFWEPHTGNDLHGYISAKLFVDSTAKKIDLAMYKYHVPTKDGREYGDERRWRWATKALVGCGVSKVRPEIMNCRVRTSVANPLDSDCGDIVVSFTVGSLSISHKPDLLLSFYVDRACSQDDKFTDMVLANTWVRRP